MLRKKR